jgi:hypothetical protein
MTCSVKELVSAAMNYLIQQPEVQEVRNQSESANPTDGLGDLRLPNECDPSRAASGINEWAGWCQGACA